YWQLSAQGNVACDVAAGRTLGQGAPHQYVLDLTRLQSGADHRVAHHMGTECRAVGHVERTLPAPGESRARGRDDHCIAHEALHDLCVGDLARLEPEAARVLADQLLHHGRRMGGAIPRLVVVPTRAGLLAEAAALADEVGRARVRQVRPLDLAPLADRPADVI